MNILKVSKVGIVITALIVCIGFLIPSELLTGLSLIMFFTCLLIYVFIKSMNTNKDNYDEYEDFYG